MKANVSLCAILSMMAVSFLVSCDKPSHEDWQTQHDKYCAQRITKFRYEGHVYLLFRSESRNSTAGMTHDANCPCHVLNTEIGTSASAGLLDTITIRSSIL